MDKKKEPSNKRVYRGKFKLSIVIFVVFMLVTFILGFNSFRIIRQEKIVKQNNIVEATLIAYRVIGRHYMAYPKIGFYYQYLDENGTKYSGSTTRTFVFGYEAAEEVIEKGQTIEIYIDGKGNSFPVGVEASKQQFIAILVSTLVFFIITIIFFIVFLVPKKIKNNDT